MTDHEDIERPGQETAGHLHRRVTAEDVARIAGVSRVAVSRAFTPGASIAVETRAKVMDAAASLGYRPNALARQLNRRAPELVAFVGGSRENYYYSEFVDRLLPALQAQGHRVLYVHAAGEHDLSEALLGVAEYPVACTIIASGSLDRSVLQKSRAVGPMIVSGPSQDLPGVDAVGVDSPGGVALAADHLVDRGRTCIACISGPVENPSGLQRAAVFGERLEARELRPVRVMHTAFTVAGGEVAARTLLAEGPKVDAILCGNDAIAIGVLNVLRGEAGLRVPDDIAVIGFDDISPAAWPSIDLSTVANPIADRIERICALIERRIDDPDAPPLDIVLPARLVVRGTT